VCSDAGAKAKMFFSVLHLVNFSWLSRCSLIRSLWKWTIFAPAWKPCGIIWYALCFAGHPLRLSTHFVFLLVRLLLSIQISLPLTFPPFSSTKPSAAECLGGQGAL